MIQVKMTCHLSSLSRACLLSRACPPSRAKRLRRLAPPFSRLSMPWAFLYSRSLLTPTQGVGRSQARQHWEGRVCHFLAEHLAVKFRFEPRNTRISSRLKRG
ncbi:unnamed protein product [Ixodes pacificus]